MIALSITQVVIDSHYEIKHSETMNDDLILDLVFLLNNRSFEPEKVSGAFQYYKADPIILNGLSYRLIWVIEENKLYVGVINAFRR
jgi:hypothetical protein